MKTSISLSIGLGMSVALHAALLAVGFGPSEPPARPIWNRPLDVVLVAAQSHEGADPASVAPPPVPPAKAPDAAAAEIQRRVDALLERQSRLLARIKDEPDSMHEALEQQHKHLAQALAEVESRIDKENARPKKRFVSTATNEDEYAAYYADLRRRIERKGTDAFPQQAGRKLYGELTMFVTVNFDGRILDTEVVRTSGNPILDRRALSIVRSSGPFGRFSDAMRRKASQIVVASRFRFTQEDRLETKLSGR